MNFTILQFYYIFDQINASWLMLLLIEMFEQ